MGPCALGLARAPHALRLSRASPHTHAEGCCLEFPALQPAGQIVGGKCRCSVDSECLVPKRSLTHRSISESKLQVTWPGLGWSESEASSHSWNLLNNKEAPTLLPELYFSWKYIRTSRRGIFILFSCTYTALSFLCPQYNQLQPQRQTLHTLKYMAESWYPVIQQTGKKVPV